MELGMIKLVLFYEPRSMSEVNATLQLKAYIGSDPLSIHAHIHVTEDYKTIHDLLNARAGMTDAPFACMMFDSTVTDDEAIMAAEKTAAGEIGLPIIFLAEQALPRTMSRNAVVKATRKDNQFIANPADIVTRNNMLHDLNCLADHPADSDRQPVKLPSNIKKMMATYDDTQICGQPLGSRRARTGRTPTSWTDTAITSSLIKNALKYEKNPTRVTPPNTGPATVALAQS